MSRAELMCPYMTDAYDWTQQTLCMSVCRRLFVLERHQLIA